MKERPLHFASLLFLFSFILLSPLFSLHAHAAGLVPCQNIITKSSDGSVTVSDSCNVCQVFRLSQNILNFIYDVISIPLGAIMLLWGGILILTGGMRGDPGAAQRGKKILTNTLIGLGIAFFAWIAIDTIIKTLAGGGNLFNAVGPWNKIECEAPTSTYFAPPPVPSTSAEPLADTCKKDDSLRDGDDVCNDSITRGFVNSTLKDPEGTGIRSERVGKCTPGALASLPSVYDNFFNSAASDTGIPKSRLQAVMMVESDGDSLARSNDNDGKSSYGLMQVRPEAACDTDPSINGCGKNSKGRGVVKDKVLVINSLTNPLTNIKVGAAKYKSLLTKYGSNDLAAASYNGGFVANQDSVDCPGVRKWQCEWDDRAHTIRNSRPGHPGFGYTRGYVPKVNATEQQIKDGEC